MHVKRDNVERLLGVTSQKFQEESIQKITDTDLIDDFQRLLNYIARKSQYGEGVQILDSDLARIKSSVSTIHNAMKRNMVEKKGTLIGKGRIQYDPFASLVTVNDHLYAMAMKTLGSPDIPESFGEDMQSLIGNIAGDAEFEIKETDFAKTTIDRSYQNQRRMDAKTVRKANLEVKKQILKKEATPYRVAQYAGAYYALKKRQEGHGRVWRFFHKKENEARTALLTEMEKTLKTVLGEGEELDKLTPIEIARSHNARKLADRANETFRGGLSARVGMPAILFEQQPTSTERADMERNSSRKDDIELENESRTRVKFENGDFKESEPETLITEAKIEDRVVAGPVNDPAAEEIEPSNRVMEF